MDHKPFLKNPNLAVKYHYLFEAHKIYEYQTEADLLN